MEWVGNRYELTAAERNLLLRGVHGQKAALERRAKRRAGPVWEKGVLSVDGHNLHITLESALRGRALVLANDGALRDLAGESSGFRLTEYSEMAMDMLFNYLEEHRPREVHFLFDAPMSQSGVLASSYRQRLHGAGLKGSARAVPVPEKEFPYDRAVVATSDSAVIDASNGWVNLSQIVLDAADAFRPLADFSSLVEACRGGGSYFPSGSL